MISRYPILASYTRNQALLTTALRCIEQGRQELSIRNVDYEHAKSVFGRALERAWDKHVMEPFVYGLQDEPEGSVRRRLFELTVMSLHDAIVAHRRVAALDSNHPAVAAALALLEEAQPLAVAIKDLKANIVKGRVPSATPAPPENPNRVTGTCSCCFRNIAVLQTTGVMAHHGYKRPMTGFQSASCPGIRFKPLEQSTQGLEWLIGYCKEQLVEREDRLRAAPEVSELRWRAVSRQEPRIITSYDEAWPQALAKHIQSCELEVTQMRRTIEHLETNLSTWLEYHRETDGLRPGTRPRQR